MGLSPSDKRKLKKNFEKHDLLFDGIGEINSFNPEYGINTEILRKFLKLTQPDEYKEIVCETSEEFLFEEIIRELDSKGTIHCLLNGIDIKTPQSQKRKLFIYYTKPNNNLNLFIHSPTI